MIRGNGLCGLLKMSIREEGETTVSVILQSWGWNLGIRFGGKKRARDLLLAFLVP